MSYATRNENGDNMGNTFVRCPIDCTKAEFARRWDACFAPKADPIPTPPEEVQRRVLRRYA